LEPLSIAEHGRSLFDATGGEDSLADWTYMAYGPFAQYEDYLNWLSENCLGDDPQFFAIVAGSQGLPQGLASYLRIGPSQGSIEVGHLMFGRSLRRTTAATEAMYLMMQRAFELGYRRYEWKCDALNEPSRRAARRLGFSFEGLFRQATIYKGRNRDTAWYAIIDKDWPALRAAYEQFLTESNFDENGNQRVRLSELTRPLLRDHR
jgi:RimJ/RimL family protein N-acetyltransferase